jgi:hypothetical protein
LERCHRRVISEALKQGDGIETEELTLTGDFPTQRGMGISSDVWNPDQKKEWWE